MSVTMRDIAQRVGVSRQVVSKALLGGRNTVRVSPAMTARIRAVADDLGYRPHAGARAVSTGRFGQIALVMPARPYLPSPLVLGIEEAAAQRDWHLTLACLPDEKLTSAGHVPKLLRELAVDGLLVNYIANIPTRMIELVEGCGFPAVWINCDRDRDTVRPADRDAGRTVARRVLAAGHRRVTFVHFRNARHYSVAARRDGCAEALAEAGLTLDVRMKRVPGYYERGFKVAGDDRLPLLRDLLRGPDRPTAIVTYNDNDAIAVLTAALSLGLRTPEDLSLATFCSGVVDAPGIVIATSLVPEPGVGAAAVDMLERRIADPDRHEPVVNVPFGWLAGQTLGPAPESIA